MFTAINPVIRVTRLFRVRHLRRIADCLISSNGIISPKLVGELRYLDHTSVRHEVISPPSTTCPTQFVSHCLVQRRGAKTWHNNEIQCHFTDISLPVASAPPGARRESKVCIWENFPSDQPGTEISGCRLAISYCSQCFSQCFYADRFTWSRRFFC